MQKIIISPITRKSNVKLLNSYTVKDIIKRWENELNINVKSEFRNHNTLSLYECLDSGLLFFYPKIAGSPNLYEVLQKKFNWYYLEDKWEYEVAFKDLKNHEHIIDLGCGRGAFVRKIIKNSNKKIIGLETNPKVIEEAEKLNLPIFNLLLEDFILNYSNFNPDAIVSFQVLEHVTEPLIFLEGIFNALHKDGLAILCVPNKNSFYQYSDDLLDMPPHHLTKWSKNSFLYLEKIFPIKLVSIYEEPLSQLHIEVWLSKKSRHIRLRKWYGKIVFNKMTFPIIRYGLRYQIWRSFIIGHTLYASFKKL